MWTLLTARSETHYISNMNIYSGRETEFRFQTHDFRTSISFLLLSLFCICTNSLTILRISATIGTKRPGYCRTSLWKSSARTPPIIREYHCDIGGALQAYRTCIFAAKLKTLSQKSSIKLNDAFWIGAPIWRLSFLKHNLQHEEAYAWKLIACNCFIERC